VEALGRGFLHPANAALVQKLRSGTLKAMDYYRQLLRVVYRLLFLFVAEDRELLFDPAAPEPARDRYACFYSTARLRRLAERLRGTQHTDLYQGLDLVLTRLGTAGSPELGLPALGGLFDPAGTADLAGCRISNDDLLEAVRALAVVSDGRSLRPVDYRNLGSEELGSVYESLLELHPQFTPDPPAFALKSASGNERKTTGSYYTPTSLITCLLDSALDPVLNEAAAKPNPEKALLDLKVCDPACGSGHFLIAAAHRLAKRLASVRTQEEEPAPDAVRHALRDVIGRCFYGVDINPMAVELCQVALWMEALEPGKPLSFLKHHVQCGNSLLGATPALLAKGIPDEAFEPIEGDEKAYCRDWKKTNKREREDTRSGQRTLEDFLPHLGNFAAEMAAMDTLPDDTPDQVRAKAERYERLASETSYQTSGRFLGDVWCAAFVWRKARGAFDFPITERIFRRVETNPNAVEPWIYDEVVRLREQYQFFHWHLAFPGVFRPPVKGEEPDNELTGWCGGFDVVLGNPPWERIKLQEKEWFAAHGRPDIAEARTAAIRSGLISRLATRFEGDERTEEAFDSDRRLHAAFLEDRRAAEGETQLVRQSGRYPLCGRGDVNTYSLFAELNRNLISPTGRVGCIVPTGIATDDTTKLFFQDLVGSGSLASVLGFENEEFLFPGVHHSTKFCLLTLTGKERPQRRIDFVFFARQVEHVSEPERRFVLSAADLALISPNTRTSPVCRSARDAGLTKAIYHRVPVLIREGEPPANPWCVAFLRMFDMAGDSELFYSAKDLSGEGWQLQGNIFRKGDAEYLPLYEAKMLHHFDHRWGTYEGQTQSQAKQGKLPEFTTEQHADPHKFVLPRHWVAASEVADKLSGEAKAKKRRKKKSESEEPEENARWDRPWLLGWRDVCRNTDSRTMISAIGPRSAVGDKFLLMLPQAPVAHLAGLAASLNSFALDYACRQKLGGTALKYFVMKQLPVLPPAVYAKPCPWSPTDTLAAWLLPRVVELTYTAWDLQPFAADCGLDGPPFRWDEDRRFYLRCELDAAFFHLYLGTGEWRQANGEPDADFACLKEAFPTPRHAVEHVMDTFPIVREHDEETHGRYRTKEQILAVYDALAEASRTGRPYQTPLDPPPADPRCRHAAPDGSLAPGAVRTLVDLMSGVPTTSFPLRLSEVDIGPDQPKLWTCHPTSEKELPPPEETWIVVKHSGLLRGSTSLAIAAGRLALNPIAEGMEVFLKGATPPARLRLTAGEWAAFRPLAVLEPATQRE
jgi:hypothetical protein